MVEAEARRGKGSNAFIQTVTAALSGGTDFIESIISSHMACDQSRMCMRSCRQAWITHNQGSVVGYLLQTIQSLVSQHNS